MGVWCLVKNLNALCWVIGHVNEALELTIELLFVLTGNLLQLNLGHLNIRAAQLCQFTGLSPGFRERALDLCERLLALFEGLLCRNQCLVCLLNLLV